MFLMTPSFRSHMDRRYHTTILNIVTSSLSLRFLKGQPEYFKKKGYEFVVVSSPGEELQEAQRAGIRSVAVSMAREISFWKDFVSTLQLIRMILRLRPAITNVGTPKAGLLGGLAACLCQVPCRYYSLLGLRCETTTGFKRRLLLITERIACACAHRVICVSESLRQKAIELGILSADKTVVLGAGSYTGVDPERFTPTAEAIGRARRIRQGMGIPEEAPVVGFVGRLTKDKGISELVEAYLALRADIPKLTLLLVGELEEGDPLPPQIRRQIECERGIFHTGFVKDPSDYYHVMDVFAFPSHREGFGTVALEANAACKPIVAARATGAVDAVIDGVTGILVPVGDARVLASALARVIGDRRLASELGSAGRERVLRDFRQEIIWEALEQEYSQMLSGKGLTVPNAEGAGAGAFSTTVAIPQ